MRLGLRLASLPDWLTALQPHSVPKFPSGVTQDAFQGLLLHSSQIWEGTEQAILDKTSKEGSKIVVIGCGKSAVDLAARYCRAGRDVTVVFDKVRRLRASRFAA